MFLSRTSFELSMNQLTFEEAANSTWCGAMSLIDQLRIRGDDWNMDYVEVMTKYDEEIVDILQCCAGCEAAMYTSPFYGYDSKNNEIPEYFVTIYKLFRNELLSYLDIDNLLSIAQLRQFLRITLV